jgi:hypothetical protein
MLLAVAVLEAQRAEQLVGQALGPAVGPIMVSQTRPAVVAAARVLLLGPEVLVLSF